MPMLGSGKCPAFGGTLAKLTQGELERRLWGAADSCERAVQGECDGQPHRLMMLLPFL